MNPHVGAIGVAPAVAVGAAAGTTDTPAAMPLVATLAVAAIVLVGAPAAILATRRRWADAGARPDERRRPLPGDDLVPNAPLVGTRAIDVDATPSVTWAWLVQVGQDRGGFYSHAWLENLVGCRMRNADRIVPEWQRREVGDPVAIHPHAPPLRVAAVDPPRSLVLLGTPDGRPADEPPKGAGTSPGRRTRTSWAFVLESRGPAASRLIVRTRTDWRPGLLNAALWRLFIDPGHCVMERAMMRGLARRAASTPRGEERAPAATATPAATAATAAAADETAAGPPDRHE